MLKKMKLHRTRHSFAENSAPSTDCNYGTCEQNRQLPSVAVHVVPRAIPGRCFVVAAPAYLHPSRTQHKQLRLAARNQYTKRENRGKVVNFSVSTTPLQYMSQTFNILQWEKQASKFLLLSCSLTRMN